MADGDGYSYSSEFSILSRARSTNKQKWFMIFYEISMVNVEDGIVRHTRRCLREFSCTSCLISGADDYLGAYWAAARPSWFTHKIGRKEDGFNNSIPHTYLLTRQNSRQSEEDRVTRLRRNKYTNYQVGSWNFIQNENPADVTNIHKVT